MPVDSESDSTTEEEPTCLREKELAAFAKLLPIRGVEVASNRVFNIWGESGVDKPGFVSDLQVYPQLKKASIVWLQPTKTGKIDTVPEFIKACSETVYYPNKPEKEESITEALESAQRGKVNPIVSDDSILITRSSIAKQKKPYFNQAAAASAGRTETLRDDIDVNVGLGESKSTNHAEGFLDALPLQSLGTDLTILHLHDLSKLSTSVIDWLRDYVFPTATRGAYRRSLILLIQSDDPLEFAYPNENWGEWRSLTEDFRLNPYSRYDIELLLNRSELSLGSATFVTAQSAGYPETANSILEALKPLSLECADSFLDTLAEPDQHKVSLLCLPERLYIEDVDLLLGPQKGDALIEWLKSLPHSPAKPIGKSKIYALPIAFRHAVLHRFSKLPEISTYAKRWAPMSRLQRKIPSRGERSKLLLLQSLSWIDRELCDTLFGKQADTIYSFVTTSENLFNRKQDKYRVSPRYREDLQQVAKALRHAAADTVREKATEAWKQLETKTLSDIEERELQIEELEKDIAKLTRKLQEANAQIRIHEKDSESDQPNQKPERNWTPPLVASGLLTAALFIAGSRISYPNSLWALLLSLISLGGVIYCLPKWLIQRRSQTKRGAHTSPEGLKTLSLDLSHKIQELETKVDSHRTELDRSRQTLKFPYVDVVSD